MKYSENPSKFGEVLKEKSKQQVLQLIGHSNYHSEFDIWSYNLIRNIFFRREMVVFFYRRKCLRHIDYRLLAKK